MRINHYPMITQQTNFLFPPMQSAESELKKLILTIKNLFLKYLCCKTPRIFLTTPALQSPRVEPEILRTQNIQPLIAEPISTQCEEIEPLQQDQETNPSPTECEPISRPWENHRDFIFQLQWQDPIAFWEMENYASVRIKALLIGFRGCRSEEHYREFHLLHAPMFFPELRDFSIEEERSLLQQEFDAYRVPQEQRAPRNQEFLREMEGNTEEDRERFLEAFEAWPRRTLPFLENLRNGIIALSPRLERELRGLIQD